VENKLKAKDGMSIRTFFAFEQTDSDEIRSEKFTIFLMSCSCCFAGVAWSVMYYFVFGAGLIAALPLSFAVIVGAVLVISHLSKSHRLLVYTQIICIIYITTLIQWSIGGVFDSGFVLAWAYCGPVIALMFLSLRYSFIWLILYLLNVFVTVIFDDFFSAHGEAVSQNTKILFLALNISVSSIVVFVFAGYFVSSALRERENANRLLLNIMPARTARELKNKKGVIAEEYDDISVLFADIAGFTEYSDDLPPDELVAKLNEIFSRFDELTEKHRLEKIKTVGDEYMVVGGLPGSTRDHLRAIAYLSLDMLHAIKEISRADGQSFSLRIGINSGPAVAGVIGKSKFAYDLWGDTVNVASRMEANGIIDHVQVSDIVYEALKDDFIFEARGPIAIKGKGMMQAHILLARKTGSAAKSAG
jgi:guanylate cyclase